MTDGSCKSDSDVLQSFRRFCFRNTLYINFAPPSPPDSCGISNRMKAFLCKRQPLKVHRADRGRRKWQVDRESSSTSSAGNSGFVERVAESKIFSKRRGIYCFRLLKFQRGTGGRGMGYHVQSDYIPKYKYRMSRDDRKVIRVSRSRVCGFRL